MSKKVLFIVGSLRQGSFNLQMALEAEKALAGKAEVSYLDYSASRAIWWLKEPWRSDPTINNTFLDMMCLLFLKFSRTLSLL